MSKVYSNQQTAILCVDMAINEGRNLTAVEDMFINVDAEALESINTKALNGLNKQISKLCLEQLNTTDKSDKMYKLLYNSATTHARRLFFAACEVFNNDEYENIADAFTKATFNDLWQAGQHRKGGKDEQPKPSEATEQPKPSEATEQPKPTADSEQPKPTADSEQPKPTADSEQPKPTADSEQPKPTADSEQPKPTADSEQPTDSAWNRALYLVEQLTKVKLTKEEKVSVCAEVMYSLGITIEEVQASEAKA